MLEAIAQKCARLGVETELDETEDGPRGDPAMLWVAFPENPRLPDGSPEYLLWIDDGPYARFALAASFEQYRQFCGRLRRVYDLMLLDEDTRRSAGSSPSGSGCGSSARCTWRRRRGCPPRTSG